MVEAAGVGLSKAWRRRGRVAATMRTNKPQCTTQLDTHAGHRSASVRLP
jgi:hypothetical protein